MLLLAALIWVECAFGAFSLLLTVLLHHVSWEQKSFQASPQLMAQDTQGLER